MSVIRSTSKRYETLKGGNIVARPILRSVTFATARRRAADPALRTTATPTPSIIVDAYFSNS
jgi:hypothetical protein